MPDDFAQDKEESLLLGRSIAVEELVTPPQVLLFRREPAVFELLWIIEGEIDFLRERNIGPGAFVLWQPNKPPGFCTGKKGMRGISVEFTIEKYPSTWAEPNAWAKWRKLEDGDICTALICYVKTHLVGSEQALVRPMLAALVAAFVTGKTSYHLPAPRIFSLHVARALNLMRWWLSKKPFETLTPQMIADEVGISRVTLHRWFREEVGRPPIAELYLARLDRAVALLARTNFPIGVIAAMAGFTNESHLAEYCQANFGMTSLPLRRALKRGRTPFPAPRSPLLMTGISADEPIEFPSNDPQPSNHKQSLRNPQRARRHADTTSPGAN